MPVAAEDIIFWGGGLIFIMVSLPTKKAMLLYAGLGIKIPVLEQNLECI